MPGLIVVRGGNPMKAHIYRVTLLVAMMALIATFDAACSFERHAAMTTTEFMSALAENRRSDLLKLTTPKARPQLDTWLASNPEFKCSVAFWDFEGERVEIYSAYLTTSDAIADNDKTVHGAMYLCRTQDSVFIMTVKDIVLTPTQEGSHQTWLVESWGETCVAHDYSTCFDKP